MKSHPVITEWQYHFRSCMPMETALLNKKNTLGNIDTYNVTRGFCRVLENLRYNKLHHFPGKFILMKFQVLHRI